MIGARTNREKIQRTRRHTLSGLPKGNQIFGWHGTRRLCGLGDDPVNKLNPCSSSACATCCILRTSFDLNQAGHAPNRTFLRCVTAADRTLRKGRLILFICLWDVDSGRPYIPLLHHQSEFGFDHLIAGRQSSDTIFFPLLRRVPLPSNPDQTTISPVGGPPSALSSSRGSRKESRSR